MNAYPPLGFSFIVDLLNNPESGNSSIATGFQEVSGIATEMNFDTIEEGGENRFVHKVPGRVNYNGNLELKRGLISSGSSFGRWCRLHFNNGLNTVMDNTKVDVQDIIVHLMDMENRAPLMSWAFARAYPVKWSVDGLNAKQSEIALESLTLAYAYFITLVKSN